MVKPDDFKGNPYGYVTNQAGHFLIGFFSPSSYIWPVFVVNGVYIDQSAVALCMLAAYFIIIELALQGWRGLDTLQDTFYVGLGLSAWLLIDMAHVINEIMLLQAVLVVALGTGALREIRRSNER